MGLEAKSDTRTTPTSAAAGSVGALLITPTPVEVGRSIIMTVSVCLSACVRPSVCEHIIGTPCPCNLHRIFRA